MIAINFIITEKHKPYPSDLNPENLKEGFIDVITDEPFNQNLSVYQGKHSNFDIKQIVETRPAKGKQNRFWTRLKVSSRL